MQKKKIYLDTSIINYLDAPHMPQQMLDTLKLWDVFIDNEVFDVVISQVVEQEIFDCPEPKLSVLLQKLSEIPYSLVSQTPEITELTELYIDYGVLNEKNRNDLLHIAHATVNGCRLITSWNFKHFVNFKTMDKVNGAHLILGYNPVKIATPSMIMGELEYD